MNGRDPEENVMPFVTVADFRADDFEEAFEVVRSAECGKVILHWD